MFDKYRKIFDDLANNYALAKLNEGKTGVAINRVKFKNEDQKNRIADVVINARSNQRKPEANNLYTSAESYSDMVSRNYPESVESDYINRNTRNEVPIRQDNQRIRRE